MSSKGIMRIKILGDDADLKKALDSAAGKLTGFATKAVGAFAAFKGLQAGAEYLKEAAQAAREDAEAQAVLHKTISNLTGATEPQLKALDQWIEKKQGATGFTEEQLRPALQKLTSSTKDVGKAQDLLSTAMDISKGRGVELNTVVTALEKAQNGNLSGLQRMGVQTKDASGKTKDFTAILGDLNKAYGGATEAAAKENVWERIKLQFGEMKEGLGAGLLPALQKFGDFIVGYMPEISALFEGAGKVIGGAFSYIADHVLPMLASAFGWLKTNVLPIITGIGDKLREVFGAFRSGGLSEGLASIGDAIKTALPKIAGKLADLGQAFVSWIGPKIPPMLAALGGLLLDLGRWIVTDALPALVSKLGEWAKALAAWVGPMIPDLLYELGALLVKIVAWIVTDAIPTIVIQIGKLALAIVEALALGLGPLLETIAKPFRDAWAAVSAFFTETFWPGVKTFFSELPGKAYEALSGLGSWVKRPFVEAWDAVSGALSWLWNGDSGDGGIKGFFTGLPGRIVEGIGDLGKVLGDFFRGLWEKIKAAVEWLVNKILGPFKAIKNWFAGGGSGNVGTGNNALIPEQTGGRANVDPLGGDDGGWVSDKDVRGWVKGLEPDAQKLVPRVAPIGGKSFKGLALSTSGVWRALQYAFPGAGWAGGIAERPYTSDHTTGHAFDVTGSAAYMAQMATWLGNNATALRIKYLIHNTKVPGYSLGRWSPSKGWNGYYDPPASVKRFAGPSAWHYDHVHVSTYLHGGVAPATGLKLVHEGERVLTGEQNRLLEGILAALKEMGGGPRGAAPVNIRVSGSDGVALGRQIAAALGGM